MANAAAAVLLLAAGALYYQQAGASADAGAGAAPADAAPSDGASWIDSIMGTIGIGATRGERNNNPGNIRAASDTWQGQTGSDGTFVTFATPQDGIRALAHLLRNYQVKYGLNTVRGLVGRYAPASENNTAAYVAAVAADMGVSPDQPLSLADAGTLDALVTAIIRHENGRVVYAAADIASGAAA